MYCESGSYTLFALFEYLVVFSNMAFHLTAVWDFKSREVMVISSSEDKDFWLETQGLSAKCTTTQTPDVNSLDPAQGEEWGEGLFHISMMTIPKSFEGVDVRQVWRKDMHMCYCMVNSMSYKCIFVPHCLIHRVHYFM